ncbi:MAG: NADH:flavin oxidoreductase [Bacteroidota bacterium]
MSSFQSAFSPLQLGSLRLKNRFIKSATSEGYWKDSAPTDAMIDWHRRIAQGGVGMTTLAYCAVNQDGRTFPRQIYLRPSIGSELRKFTSAMHREGAAASIQLAHSGYFSKVSPSKGRGPKGPSFIVNEYGMFSGLPFGYALKPIEIDQIVDDYGLAAQMAVEVGFDAIELHAGHGYLLSQFLCPKVNRRKDQYGGTLENRARLALEVMASIRSSVPPDFPVLVKINLADGFRLGLQLHEAILFAQMLEDAGASALILSGGYTSKTPFYLLRGGRPLKEMIRAEGNRAQRIGMRLFGPGIVKQYPFEEMFFFDMAKEVRKQVKLPLALIGGIVSRDNINRAMDAGFDLLALGRALIHDPEFVNHLKDGSITRSGCTACNGCIPQMDLGGVYCVLKPEGRIVNHGA